VIRTSARIGSPGPGRFPYSHCSWVPLRPSDSDFSQNWKPGTREISHCDWAPFGPGIPTSAKIGSLGLGRFPYSHCGWAPLPRDSDFGQNWTPGTREIPLLSLWLGAIWPRDSDFGQNWKPGTGEIPLLSLRLCAIWPMNSDFGQNWKPGTGEIPLLFSNDPRSFNCMNYRQSTHHSAALANM
jgi:hypothetical protein